MSKQKMKIGVIGAGSISDMHLQSYEKNQGVELKASSVPL